MICWLLLFSHYSSFPLTLTGASPLRLFSGPSHIFYLYFQLSLTQQSPSQRNTPHKKEKKKDKRALVILTFTTHCLIQSAPLLSRVGECLASVPLDPDRNALSTYSAEQKGVKLVSVQWTNYLPQSSYRSPWVKCKLSI